MNTYRHEDELFRRWVDEGVDVAPRQAVETALLRITTTRQRRELALLRRMGVMDLAGQRRGQAAWRAALGAVAVIGIIAVSFGVVGVVLPKLGNQGSDATPSRTAEKVIAAAVSAQPAGTALRAVGPGLEEILTFLIDSRSAGEIRAIGDVAANEVVGFQGTDDTRRYLVAAIVFGDEAGASGGFTTLANAFGDSRSPTGTSEGSWYAAPSGWVESRGDDARLFLGPFSVVTTGSPGQAVVWRTGRAVVVVVGVAREPGLAAQVDSEVTGIADAVQAEVDRLMR